MITLFLIYILKSALCLSGFYLIYRLWLSKETFHRFNRILLVGLLMISFIIPSLKVSENLLFPRIEQTFEYLNVPKEEMGQELMHVGTGQAVEMGEHVQQEIRETNNGILNPINLLFLYLCGILLLFLRYIGSTMCINRLIRHSEKKFWKDGVKLAIHRQDTAPFAWKRWIVISQQDLDEYGEPILAHEYAHILHGHFWDLLLAEVCLWLQWFNPAMWLLGKELRALHEFEADESVLKAGIDAKQYQLLLIRKTVGTRLYSMVNSFDHGSLKKRITMMLKEKSKPRKILRYLIVLPLTAVAVVLFARPNMMGMNHSPIEDFKSDTLHFDEIPILRSYAESDTVQILRLDPKLWLPVGFTGWSFSTAISNESFPCIRKAVFQKEVGGVIRLSSSIPWSKEALAEFTEETKMSMLKSLNETYGKKDKKQNDGDISVSSSTTTYHFASATYNVEDFFKIYCKEGEGIGYDGQLILLDGKDISYQQLKKLSVDSLISAHEVYPQTTNLKEKFGMQAAKGVWVIVSKKNPSYWDEFMEKIKR